MKKVLLIVVGVIALSSCSKKGDYTCACVTTTDINSVIQSTSNVNNSILGEKEDDAEKECDSGEDSASTNNGGSTLTVATVCTLHSR